MHPHKNARFSLSEVFRPQSSRYHQGHDRLSRDAARPSTAHPHSRSHASPRRLTREPLTNSHLRSPRKSRHNKNPSDENVLTLIEFTDKKHASKDSDASVEDKPTKGSSFDEKRYSTFESWVEGSHNNSEEFDTDIEDDEDDVTEKSVDPTGVKTYKEQCKKHGIVPASCMLRDLGKRNIRLCHRYLGALATKSLALAFKMNTVTECLDLADNYLQAEGAYYLASMLRENMFIVHLDLSNNFIQSDGVCAVARMLEVNTTLKTLSLAGNQLKDEDAHLFIDALKNNISLTSLDLSHNGFGEKGGEMLAAAVICSESLTNLDLSWNSINGKGAVALANALKVNISLEVLDLSWNGFGVGGSKAFQNTLPMNTTLRVLDLTNNHITSKAVTHLAAGLKRNLGLETLILNLNPLGDDGVQEILKVVADQQNLRVLSIEEIGINQQNFKLINELQQDKHITVLYGGLGGYWRNTTSSSIVRVFVKFVHDHHAELANSFHQRDVDRSGVLTVEDIKLSITEAGFRLTNKQLDMLIDKIDSCNTGSLKYRDILSGQIFSSLHTKPRF